jgi:hypothetical protein
MRTLGHFSHPLPPSRGSHLLALAAPSLVQPRRPPFRRVLPVVHRRRAPGSRSPALPAAAAPPRVGRPRLRRAMVWQEASARGTRKIDIY